MGCHDFKGLFESLMDRLQKEELENFSGAGVAYMEPKECHDTW